MQWALLLSFMSPGQSLYCWFADYCILSLPPESILLTHFYFSLYLFLFWKQWHQTHFSSTEVELLVIFLSRQNQPNIHLCSLICTGCLWFLTHSHSFHLYPWQPFSFFNLTLRLEISAIISHSSTVLWKILFRPLSRVEAFPPLCQTATE